jgi:hypothetical protein
MNPYPSRLRILFPPAAACQGVLIYFSKKIVIVWGVEAVEASRKGDRDMGNSLTACVGLWAFVALCLASCKGPEKAAGPTVSADPPAVPAASADQPAKPVAQAPGSAFFPPEGTDHLAMTVHAAVEIFAIGKDDLVLEGTVAVHRSGPAGPDGKRMEGAMVGAALRGTSKVFGEVVAIQSPLAVSPCEYVYEGPGRYKGHFEINGWFWLPRQDLWFFNATPIRVEGTAAAIPPVGQKADMVAQDVVLEDLRKPDDNPVGDVKSAKGEVHRVVPIEEYLKTPPAKIAELKK